MGETSTNAVQMSGFAEKKEVSVPVSKIVKFSVLGCLGLFLFLVPVFDGTVPIMQLVNVVKGLFGSHLTVIARVVCAVLGVSLILGKIFKIPFFSALFEGDAPWKIVIYVLSVVFTALLSFGIAPTFLADERVGLRALTIGSTVFLTISITGWAVILILESGIIEFFGILIEPVMRPLFRLPGHASVDAISSFVSSPAVGGYITNQNYVNGLYTRREAFAVATGFSVMSVGYMGVLCSMAEIESCYGILILSSFILVALIGLIVVRIPPISRIPAVYSNGREQTPEERRVQKLEHPLRSAAAAAAAKSDDLTWRAVGAGLVNAVRFAFKIVGFAIPIVIIALSVVNYTSFFTIIGKVIAPYIALFRIPGANEIAPSALIGIIEITLPTITAIAYDLPDASYFFVILLSSVQIIFFTECVNAILASSFEAKFRDLVIMFFERTLIAIPLVAAVTHLVFRF